MGSDTSEKAHSDEWLLNEEEEGETSPKWSKSSRERSSWQTFAVVINVVLFVISVGLSAQRYWQDRHESAIDSMRKTSFYSPVFDTMKMEPIVKETNGTLFAPTNPSRFRNDRTPDPVVNDAWEELEWIRVFPMTADQVRKLGKDPEISAKFPESYGLGPDAYVGQLDVFHQIHCLNLLRHVAWAEFDRNETVGKRPYSELHWIHLSHCTDILMQNLMCNGNLDVITFNWMETQALPFPDFNVNHQCRDFDAIWEWQEKYTVPKLLGRNFTKPVDGNIKQVPIDPDFLALVGSDEGLPHPDRR